MIVTIIVAAILLAFLLLSQGCNSEPNKPKKGGFEITFTFENNKIKGKNMALTALPNQRIPFTLQPVDRKGNPATVEAGTVEYWIDDETVATVEEDTSNELAGWVVTTAPGVTQLNYTADADLGEGVTQITGFDAIEVKPEQATGFGITFGPAEDI